ncbi:hypothetical protein ACFU7X_02470 [Streptomyces chartreusis]|uniref:hypothetical protein n=1 Tax=Streptomyces chartreusis TaxID=1969 RepID=UPI0036B0E1C3
MSRRARAPGGKVTNTTLQRFQEEVRRMQQLTLEQVPGIVPDRPYRHDRGVQVEPSPLVMRLVQDAISA